jgi:RNA polymerase sigma-70 factor (ECF subfamily)
LKNKSVGHIADLVLKCREGQNLAQYQLFNKYYENMFVVCNRIVGNSADAEEIVQDAFVNAFYKIKELHEPAAFGSWLKQMVVNRSINFVKRRKKIKWEELLNDTAGDANEEEAIYKLDKDVVAAAVMQLPQGSRVVFTLYLIEGYKHHEIAAMLGISVSTSKSQYQRAKSILKEKLTKIVYER